MNNPAAVKFAGFSFIYNWPHRSAEGHRSSKSTTRVRIPVGLPTSLIAQLEERISPKDKVPGSIPGGATNIRMWVKKATFSVIYI